MYQQQGRMYKWQSEWNGRGRGRGRGRGYGGWRQFGPPPTACPCACHKECGKCCLGWEAAPPTIDTLLAAAPAVNNAPAAAPAVNNAPAAAPVGWVRLEDLRGLGLAPMHQPVAEPAPMQPMEQPPPPPPGWIRLDADGNIPSAQPR